MVARGIDWIHKILLSTASLQVNMAVALSSTGYISGKQSSFNERFINKHLQNTK